MNLRRLSNAVRRSYARFRNLFHARPGDRALEERLSWIFGSPRTGSSWLALQLLASHPQVDTWDEPYLGTLLGARNGLERRVVEREAARPQFVLAQCHESLWQPALRQFVLDNVRGRFSLGDSRRLIIKEPNGSAGADVLLGALPWARMIFLMRDPRDVLDSKIDMHRPGSWNPRPALQTPEDRLRRINVYAETWILQTSVVEKAYERQDPARRLLIKYEDLRRDTVPQLCRAFEFIGLPIAVERAEQIVAQYAFESLPEEAKGPGKFARAASPGHWRNNLGGAERAVIQKLFGPWLAKYGYEADDTAEHTSFPRLAA